VPEYRRADRKPLMINRILCPIDFSETSRHALEQAAAIAGWYRARLHVLHVYNPVFAPVPSLPAPGDRVPHIELERVRDEAAAFVQSSVRQQSGADVGVGVGKPASTILERAAELSADMIVIGTHGTSGFERLFLGSVTEKVLRKAVCPVLTVPPRAHAASRLPFTRVLCAVDFSEWSTAAVDLAASLAAESRASLDVLHVIEWPWEEPPPPVFAELPPEQAAALLAFRQSMVSSATRRLESVVSKADTDRCAVTVQVAHGKPYVETLRIAGDIGADLIVLGVHGRNPIDLAVFGSTTNQVVRRATCPVLTVRR
jgi:nucleotide-binding universal stress UspA family protein